MSKTHHEADKTVYWGQALSLRVSPVMKTDGRTTTREIVEHPNSVALLAIDKKGNAILVQQHREAVGKELLEIPSASWNRERPPWIVSAASCAKRLVIPLNMWRKSGEFTQPQVSAQNTLSLYLATELEYDPLYASDTDEIQVERVPLHRVPGLLASGRIEDAKSVAGLFTMLAIRPAMG